MNRRVVLALALAPALVSACTVMVPPRLAGPGVALPPAWCAHSGAIAYSPSTGQIGWSTGYASEWLARGEAIRRCGYADCEWKVSETNEFAALVVSSTGTYVGWDPNLFRAEANALVRCQISGAPNCSVERWVEN